MVYCMPQGFRDAAKIKTAAQLEANPTSLVREFLLCPSAVSGSLVSNADVSQYVPPLPPGEKFELLIGYMDDKTYTYKWSEALTVESAADEREARQLNRKRQLELNPPQVTQPEAQNAPLVSDERDAEVVEEVCKFIKPQTLIPELRDVLLATFGKDLVGASYAALRAAGLSIDHAAAVLAAVWVSNRFRWKEEGWATVLGLTTDELIRIEAIVRIPEQLNLVDEKMLADCEIPFRKWRTILDKCGKVSNRSN